MKTMKLLPLKIAVTSAMIVGLGAASTANAQTVEYDISSIGEANQGKMVFGDTFFVENQTTNDISMKFYSDSDKTLPSSMLFDQFMTNQRLKGFKAGQPFIPVDDNGNPITQVDNVIDSNGQTKKVRSVTTRIATEEDVEKSAYAQGIQKDIDDLYKYDQEVTNIIDEIHDHNKQQNETLENLITNSTKNTDNIAKNKADVEENKVKIEANSSKITNLGTLFQAHAGSIEDNESNIKTNKDAIVKNKADADTKFQSVQTDIANNKTTLAEHTKKIDDNKQAIEEKLGGKADLQKLSELKTSVDKNQADITKNKADADASFKTLTENQNTLIEKDKAQDTLIAKNKADADAKLQGVQLDIANNKTTLAQNTKKIDENQQAIEAKLGGKADAQALNSLNDKVNGFDGRVTELDTKVNGFDGRISALDTKVNAFDGRITALDSKVENGMAAQAALSGLFQPYSVGKFNATAALGGYGSKSAVAIGAGYRVNPNLAFKAGAAINTSGDKKALITSV
ncbi:MULTISPECIES: YadA-like family protein [Moraxella]|uniref:Trimeric autotransporter adhesin YadA-like C-terminal membrane anchor domain-containing protein n=1 Tax=Moraxella catarrhalis TaxID=480 RepID=A0A7Z0UXP3_MORCA|nr:YadA C-terminal domain-containing protein [Moraxella catarrhalis]OAV00133.1 hypothetical protein AO382_1611 [Moraxella catarrhalis]STY81198.1 Adhesin yadA precursor [Moraxella catarrhalis]